MACDMGYFKLVWRTDPTYGPDDAVKEYLAVNPEVARDIVYQMDRDDMPFDYEILESYLETLDPVSAFFHGLMSTGKFSLSDDYFRIDAYENVESLSDHEFDEWCTMIACDNASDIVKGEYEIPEELETIIRMWDVLPEDLGLSYFENRKLARTGRAKPTIRGPKVTLKKAKKAKTEEGS